MPYADYNQVANLLGKSHFHTWLEIVYKHSLRTTFKMMDIQKCIVSSPNKRLEKKYWFSTKEDAKDNGETLNFAQIREHKGTPRLIKGAHLR